MSALSRQTTFPGRQLPTHNRGRYGEGMRIFQGYPSAVRALRFAPGGRYLLARSWLGTLQRWDWPPAGPPRTLLKNASWIQDMAVTDEGVVIATNGAVGNVVRDPMVGESINAPFLMWDSARDYIYGVATDLVVYGSALLPGGDAVLLVDRFADLSLHQLDQATERWRITNPPFNLQDNPWLNGLWLTGNGETALLRDAQRDLWRIDMQNGCIQPYPQTAQLPFEDSILDSSLSVELGPAAAWLICLVEDPVILDQGPFVAGSWTANCHRKPNYVPRLYRGHDHPRPCILDRLDSPPESFVLDANGRSGILAAAWSLAGDCIAVANRTGAIALWDVALPQAPDNPTPPVVQQRALYDWGLGEVNCLAFAPDGLTLAAGGPTGQIIVWDLA